jgi:hypothetical protein
MLCAAKESLPWSTLNPDMKAGRGMDFGFERE